MSAAPDSYSAVERRFLGPSRRLLLGLYAPLVRLCVILHISPNTISFAQVPLGLIVVWAMPRQPRLAFLLFVLAVALDGMDGALARSTNQATRFGALFDQVCDHIREVTVISGLALYGALNPFLAGLYGLAYPASNLILYLCNSYGTPVPVAIKSYLIVYPALFAYLWFDVNVTSAAVALSLLTMSLTVGTGLWRLRGAMK